MRTLSFEQLSSRPYAMLARYARWLAVDVAGTQDSGPGRRKLAMRIARALKRGAGAQPKSIDPATT